MTRFTIIVIFSLFVSAGVAFSAEVGPVIAPTLDTEIGNGRTVVYCPTLEVAWKKFQGVMGGPIEMENPDPLLAKLNAAKSAESALPEGAYVALAGRVSDGTVQRIEQQLQRQFGRLAPQLPRSFRDPLTELVTYCHLQRMLPFHKKFAEPTSTPLNFKSRKNTRAVRFFGVAQDADSYKGVRILGYKGPDEYSLQLATKIRGEYVMVSRIPEPVLLGQGVDRVKAHLAESQGKPVTNLAIDGEKHMFLNSLGSQDVVAIPILALRVEHMFSELCNRRISNKASEGIAMSRVHQSIAFRMDGKGATVRSTAYGDAFGALPKKRQFVFDKPFLVTVWKQNGQIPYFALWAGSADVMVPFKPKAK